jgi:hypothetical protein
MDLRIENDFSSPVFAELPAENQDPEQELKRRVKSTQLL